MGDRGELDASKLCDAAAAFARAVGKHFYLVATLANGRRQDR
jgi:hypothetical protein